jgi:hypothetical protein
VLARRASATYNSAVEAVSPVRRMLLIVLAIGLTGTLGDLLLLSHYEDRAQWIPLPLLAGALLSIAWHVARPTAASVRVLQGIMALVVVAAFAGMALHYNGAAAFQLEVDPSLSWWDVARKAARAQSPPILAPGAMLQLGLVGLAYTYRHPVIARGRAHEEMNT